MDPLLVLILYLVMIMVTIELLIHVMIWLLGYTQGRKGIRNMTEELIRTRSAEWFYAHGYEAGKRKHDKKKEATDA